MVGSVSFLFHEYRSETNENYSSDYLDGHFALRMVWATQTCWTANKKRLCISVVHCALSQGQSHSETIPWKLREKSTSGPYA